MAEQNYKNHRRYSFSYHVLTLLAILALLAGSIVNLSHSDEGNRYSASLILLVAILFISIFFHARAMALKAQDRAIRAEESLRYFILSGGRPLDSRIRISQVIALRFASDEELVELARRAAEENLSGEDIKKAIRNWRADLHRV
ncbi:DUF6526 family protein [Flavihumibacter rivuli]|uniref:DUF6526 family protein n=1 Tax=Flavihumibacter rivuli TaxID=2838156 RepID=UPI001BDEC187|nr:DUF6526 family protein [Flavihumibacter rivuli]ULQ57995.1 DUF6526 family protein [Flavihumibacter rivuli]